MKRVLGALTLASTLLVAAPRIARAATEADCWGQVGGDGRSVGCSYTENPDAGASVGGAQSRLPARWTVILFDTIADPGLGGPPARVACDPATGAVLSPGAPPLDPPSYRLFVLVRDANGVQVALESECPGPDGGIPSWFPPTRAEIERALASEPWPASTTGIDPAIDGLTGLPTRFWSTTLAAAPVSVRVRNSTVVGTAMPLEYRWQLGDGATASSSRPGTPAAPAVTHVYETKGPYDVTLEVVWQADVEVSVELPSGRVLRFAHDPPLQPVSIAGVRPYRVVEIRSVLVP